MMKKFASTLSVFFIAIASTNASADERVHTRKYTCSALKVLILKQAAAILAPDTVRYEMIYRDSGTCKQDETSAPAFEPSSDVELCFVGWRCKQRNSDGGIG